MGRAFQVKLVKEGSASAGPSGADVTPEEINALVKDQVEHLVLSIGALLLAKKAADTVSELILIAGRKHI